MPACVVVALLGAVTVTVAVPELVTEAGETEQVVPGSDEGTLQLRDTLPVKPFSAEMVSVEAPTLAVAPAVNVKLVGETLAWKSGVELLHSMTRLNAFTEPSPVTGS